MLQCAKHVCGDCWFDDGFDYVRKVVSLFASDVLGLKHRF